MNATPQRTLNVVAAIGLGLGAVFGPAGTMVTASHLQSTSWAIDSVGWVVATALLTLTFFRRADDVVAAGFLVFCTGESVLLRGQPPVQSDACPPSRPGPLCGRRRSC
jgi:hypothetical protein